MRTIQTSTRKCGTMQEGGVYVLTEGSADGILPMFVRLNPPVPYDNMPHRGPKYVDGAQILGRKPRGDWWIASTKKHEEGKAGKAWELETFGMTSGVRLKVGAGQDFKTLDSFYEWLYNSVTWDDSIHRTLRRMTNMSIPDIGAITEHYAALIRHLQTYQDSLDRQHLVSALAAIWRIHRHCPADQKLRVYPQLSALCYYLNVKEDGFAIMYGQT